jgi:putative phosphoribosyl transferase
VRKLGAPGNPELGVGAVTEDGTGVLDPRSAAALGTTQSSFDATLASESHELPAGSGAIGTGTPRSRCRGEP